METLLKLSTLTIKQAIEQETFVDKAEKVGYLKEVELLIQDHRIPSACLCHADLLRLYRTLLLNKHKGGGSMAKRLLNLLDQVVGVPECPSLWKVIYKRITIDELPTLAFILTKAMTGELYQFVGNSYLFKMSKEEMLCLKSLIELSELYAMTWVNGAYNVPLPKEGVELNKQQTKKENWDYSFSLS